ncbi:MAG TPA: HAMP domain-containing sensor histidine kinase [Gemmatimonadales bacterium]|nr:HAMP domain-containing sensor histidine kinase [Gemmatimonadales bacterium]
MTFRSRILLATVPVVLVPLVVFGLGVRRAMRQQIAGQYRGRVTALVDLIGQDLERQGTLLATRLARLRNAAVADNRFRLAALARDSLQRSYALDYAGTAMRLTGLDMLQIQDDSARIISSGHFRNEFDRVERGLPRLLPTAPNGMALVQARTAEGPFFALARLDSLPLGDRYFTVVGGILVDSGFLARLARDSTVTVSLVLPGATLSSRASAARPADEVVSELPVPFVEAAQPESAQLVPARLLVATPLTGLQALQRTVDLWFVIAVLVTLLVTVLLAAWLASRLSRPLAQLATKTAEINMDRLDVEFSNDGKDEVGALERLLGQMTERLRAGTVRLREVERRAATGELARQVNHDVKNGLAPLRNVLRHLAQVARDRPLELPKIFAERRQALVSSLNYLESLAANYAKLSPPPEAQRCDVNTVTRETVEQLPAASAEINTQLARGVGEAKIDAIALRRILENLVSNAVESLGDQPGVVTISTTRGEDEGATDAIRIVVEDTGKGMTESELESAFQDFHTTKPGGVGLGLSIVRRLVTDAGGRLRVETSPGAGSRFIVEVPVVEGAT